MPYKQCEIRVFCVALLLRVIVCFGYVWIRKASGSFSKQERLQMLCRTAKYNRKEVCTAALSLKGSERQAPTERVNVK